MTFDLDRLFQKSALIPVVVQDWQSREVLMVGFTNRKAVELTLETKTAWFWSRSRGSFGTRAKRREIFCM